jgi:hypothetical protein
MRKFLLCLLISSLTGCIGRRVDVQTLYLTRESLASAIVVTPDPALFHPSIGQRLLVQWNLRREFCCYQTLSFKLTVRFRTHQEQVIQKQIKTKQGSYLYELLDDAFCQSGGIVTYRLEIYGDNCLIDSWQHPLWAKLITFDYSLATKDPASSADPLTD